MGALSKAAETVDSRRKGPPCTTGVALAAMDEEDRRNLTIWASEAGDPASPRRWSWIEDTCMAAGIRLDAERLRRHFQGRCRCDG